MRILYGLQSGVPKSRQRFQRRFSEGALKAFFKGFKVFSNGLGFRVILYCTGLYCTIPRGVFPWRIRCSRV